MLVCPTRWCHSSPVPTLVWWSPLLGAVLAFFVNFLWFGPKTFYPVWVRALGRNPEDPPPNAVSPGLAFGGTLIALLVQAYGVAIVIALRVASGTEVGPIRGALIGAIIGIVFAAAASLGHRLFSGQGLKVWLIEAGGDVAGLASIGLVVGIWH